MLLFFFSFSKQFQCFRFTPQKHVLKRTLAAPYGFPGLFLRRSLTEFYWLLVVFVAVCTCFLTPANLKYFLIQCCRETKQLKVRPSIETFSLKHDSAQQSHSSMAVSSSFQTNTVSQPLLKLLLQESDATFHSRTERASLSHSAAGHYGL